MKIYNLKKINSKHRLIKTKIPAPGTSRILKDLENTESRSMHGQLPIIWKKAESYNVFDIADNKYIDFTSTIFVANIGHSNPNLIKKIKRCLDNSLISTYSFATSIRKNYIKKLLSFAGKNFQKAFLLSSGTEASEVILKLMKLNAIRLKKSKAGIISLNGNWHGRTMGAQILSSDLNQKNWINYKKENIFFMDFPYPWILKKEKISGKNFAKKQLSIMQKKNKLDFKKDISGLMLETFQGWGALFYPKDYVTYLSKFCKQNNIILAFDEMQSGFARTGKKFGFMHYGVEPDLICCGKGMGGGLPLSGVLGKKILMDLPEVGSMSSTHSANPLVCEAGMAVLDEIKNKNLVYKSAKKGKLMIKFLNDIKKENPKLISHISGRGLIASVIFNPLIRDISKIVSRIVMRCMQNGVLLIDTHKNAIKLGPPLVIPDSAILEGLNILKKSIKDEINNK